MWRARPVWAPSGKFPVIIPANVIEPSDIVVGPDTVSPDCVATQVTLNGSRPSGRERVPRQLPVMLFAAVCFVNDNWPACGDPDVGHEEPVIVSVPEIVSPLTVGVPLPARLHVG